MGSKKKIQLEVISTNITDREIDLEYCGLATLSDNHLCYIEKEVPHGEIEVEWKENDCELYRRFNDYELKMNFTLNRTTQCSVTTLEGVMEMDISTNHMERSDNQWIIEYELMSNGQSVQHFRKVWKLMEEVNETK